MSILTLCDEVPAKVNPETTIADAINLMTAGYNVDRAKLDASKAEVVSEIEGAKSRIQVGVSEGEKKQVETSIDTDKALRRQQPRRRR